jgi:predicted kinase
MTEKTYNRLLVLGITLANQGWSVILDAKYDRKHLRQQVIDQANKHQLPGKIVYCTAPLEVLEERIIHRSSDITDATPELLAGQVAQYEPFTEEELPYIMVVDTTQPLAQQFNGKFR